MSDEDELAALNAGLKKTPQGDDAELAALNAQLPKQSTVSASEDVGKSFVSEAIKSVINQATGLGAGEQAYEQSILGSQAGNNQSDYDPAKARSFVEQNITGPLYEPQTPWGRYGGAVGGVLGNPASWVGPGGPAVKLLAGAGSAIGSEGVGDILQAFGKEGLPWQMAGRLIGGLLGGAGALGTGAGVVKGVSKLSPGLAADEAGAVVAPGVGGVGGGPPTPPANPLAGYDPMAVTKLARQVQQSDMTPADWEARFAQLGPQGFLAEGSRNLMGGAAGIASDVGPGMNTLYRAFEERGAQAARGQRIDQALTDALGPRVNIPEQTAAMEAARSTAADPLYEQWRNTTVPMTPDLEALLPRLNATGATAAAYKNMAIEGKPPGPTAETWDYMKRALDDEIGPAIRGGFNNKARIYTNLKNDLTDALDNHPDPNVAGIYRAARQAYAGPSAIQNATEAGQELFDRSVHPDQFAIDWRALSNPEKQAMQQGARSALADIMDATNRGVTNVVSKVQAPAAQAKLRTMIGDVKTNQVVQAAEREAGFAGNRTTIGHGSDTALRQSGREEFRTPESPLTANQIYMPGVSTQPFTFIPGALHNRYLNWFYPRMRQSAAQMYVTQGPTAADLTRALLAHQIPQNPFGQAVGHAAAPSIVNALMQRPPPQQP